jgi:hypothetical protein
MMLIKTIIKGRRLFSFAAVGTMGKREAQEPATLGTVDVYNKGRVKPDGSKEQRYYLRTKGAFGRKKKRRQSPSGEWDDFEISPPTAKKHYRNSGFWQQTGYFFASSARLARLGWL